MADRSVVVRLRAEVGEYVRNVKAAATATGQIGEKAKETAARGRQGFSDLLGWVDQNEQAVNSLTTQVGLVGVGLTAMAGVAVKKFADFDQAMSNVAATGADARENITALREAAVDAGARTVYSATEAAAAIENLAKAGLSAGQILDGGLDGALDLAAAGGMAVADAAEIAASAMTQFGLGGDKARHVADLLAAGAGKAQGEVHDLGMALNQSGLVANQMGLSVEETTGTLTAFAKAGLIGSDAGTSFRAMLLRLANPTKESADLMAELGINAYDATGQFVGMEALAGQLQTRLGGLTQEQRNAALAQIFGMDAIRSASILYEQGAEGIREWTDAVDEQGYAAEVARTRLDNLRGDLEALSGSLDTVFIRSGSGANDVLRSIVQSAESVVDAIGQIPEPVLGAITMFVGTAGLVTLGVAGLGKLVIAISSVKASLDTLKISARTAGLATAAAAGVIAAGAIALTVWAQNAADARARTQEFQATLDETGRVTDRTLSTINEKLSSNTNTWVDNLFGEDPQSLIDRAEEIGLAMEDLQGYILGTEDAQQRVNAAFEDYVGGPLSGQMSQANRDRLSEIRPLIDGLEREASALTEAEKAAGQKALADEAAGVAADENATAIDRLAAATEDGTAATEDYTSALDELIDAQAELAGIVLTERDAQRQFEAALDDVKDALQAQVDELANQYEAQGMGADAARQRAQAEVDAANKLDISTEAGRRNQAALDDVAGAGWDLIESMHANGATQEELQATMAATRERFLEAAAAMGLSAEDANQLADELGLIPDRVDVEVAVVDNASARLDAIVGKIRSMPSGHTITINQRTMETTVTSGRGNTIARAAGGPVHGPGTATSDSVPAIGPGGAQYRLSAGEHVWTAAETSAVGGHSGVERLRSLARRKALPAFAGGGGIPTPAYGDARYAFASPLSGGAGAGRSAGAAAVDTSAIAGAVSSALSGWGISAELVDDRAVFRLVKRAKERFGPL